VKPGLFVDTGFWIALLDRRDSNHAAARDSLARLVAGYRLYVSDYVVFETLTYLNCSLRRHDLAIRFLEKTESAGFNVLEIDRATKEQAIRLFRQFSDKDFSVTDCTSFAVMTANGIRHFAGFDSHFEQMSFLSGLARD
jgi:predicted nucleic acid-binding protein